MVFFINDTKVRLTENIATLTKEYDIVLKNVRHAEPKHLKGKVLIVGTHKNVINEFVDIIEGNPLKRLKSITFIVSDKEDVFEAVKSHFKLVKAAGGIVEKGGKILLIHRLGKWDLPKGKLDKGETIPRCAIREVEEETGVKASLSDQICISYHTYVRNKKRSLKKTYWYSMKCVDDKKMKPQAEENIDEVKWCTREEAEERMSNSYESLKRVLKKYYKANV